MDALNWSLLKLANIRQLRLEYHGRLLELLDSYSPTTNTMDAYWSSLDSYLPTTNTIGRLLELLDSYSPATNFYHVTFELELLDEIFAATNTMDAYWSCWNSNKIVRRDRIPWTLIGVAGLLFADEYHADAYWSCWTLIMPRRIPWTWYWSCWTPDSPRRIALSLDAYWSCWYSYSPRRFYHKTCLLCSCWTTYSSTTNTMDACWSCWTPIRRRRIPWTLIGVEGLLFTDDRIPWTLIGVAGLLFADERIP